MVACPCIECLQRASYVEQRRSEFVTRLVLRNGFVNASAECFGIAIEA